MSPFQCAPPDCDGAQSCAKSAPKKLDIHSPPQLDVNVFFLSGILDCSALLPQHSSFSAAAALALFLPSAFPVWLYIVVLLFHPPFFLFHPPVACPSFFVLLIHFTHSFPFYYVFYYAPTQCVMWFLRYSLDLHVGPLPQPTSSGRVPLPEEWHRHGDPR